MITGESAVTVSKRTEITKKKIAYSASLLFAEKGYTNTTVREICAKAGVALSRMNYHFNTKLDLALYIFKATNNDLVLGINKALENEKDELIKSIAFIRLWMGAFLAGENYTKFCADLVDEGVLQSIIFDEFRDLFLRSSESEKAKIGHIDVRNCTLLYISSFASLIRAKANGLYDRTPDEFADIFSYFFLMLLGVLVDEQESILDKSKLICKKYEGKPYEKPSDI